MGVPCVNGYYQLTRGTGGLEFRCPILHLNYTYEQPLTEVRMHRPPRKPHPECTGISRGVLRGWRGERIATKLVRDLNINTWSKGYGHSTQKGNLGEPADPDFPGRGYGAAGDMTFLAVGSYMPDGVLPGEAETGEETDSANCSSASLTGSPVV